MSKKGFNVDIGDFNKTTDMDSIYAGNTPTPIAVDEVVIKDTPKKETIVKQVKKQVEDKSSTISNPKDANYDAKLTIATDKQGNPKLDKQGNKIYNKDNNYTMTFKIDADLEEYFTNLDAITFIENIKNGKPNGETKTEFLNDYIRQQFYKLIGASGKDTEDTINKKWAEYKHKNNL